VEVIGNCQKSNIVRKRYTFRRVGTLAGLPVRCNVHLDAIGSIWASMERLLFSRCMLLCQVVGSPLQVCRAVVPIKRVVVRSLVVNCVCNRNSTCSFPKPHPRGSCERRSCNHDQSFRL